MTHNNDRFKNTYKVLTEETKKRTEGQLDKYIYRSPSMIAHLKDAKDYGRVDSNHYFPEVEPLSQDHEDALRYALCRSIIYIRNRSTLDPDDKFDLISILIKDWRFGYSKRNESRKEKGI